MKQLLFFLLLFVNLSATAQIDSSYIHTDYSRNPAVNYVNIQPIALPWRTLHDSVRRVYLDVAAIGAISGQIPYTFEYNNDSSGQTFFAIDKGYANPMLNAYTTKMDDAIGLFMWIASQWNNIIIIQ